MLCLLRRAEDGVPLNLERVAMELLESHTKLSSIAPLPDSRRFGGFWIRSVAYLLDAIPILLVVTFTIGPMIGFSQAWKERLDQPRDAVKRRVFLDKRNTLRNISALVLVTYGVACEASPLQGTLGKRLLGMRVAAADGGRLGLLRCCVRNVTKILGGLPLGLGWIWAAFNRRKQAWHDKAAQSLVVRNSGDWRDRETFKPFDDLDSDVHHRTA